MACLGKVAYGTSGILTGSPAFGVTWGPTSPSTAPLPVELDATNPACKIYVARKGDYISKVAQIFNVELEDLLLDNQRVILDLDEPIEGRRLRLCNVPANVALNIKQPPRQPPPAPAAPPRQPPPAPAAPPIAPAPSQPISAAPTPTTSTARPTTPCVSGLPFTSCLPVSLPFGGLAAAAPRPPNAAAPAQPSMAAPATTSTGISTAGVSGLPFSSYLPTIRGLRVAASDK
eukprot:jgi/Chrzof1/6389/Cz18g08150.t1